MAGGATVGDPRANLGAKLETAHWLEIVERQVRGLKFGSVQVTVHEGRVVQIETSAKIRFDRS